MTGVPVQPRPSLIFTFSLQGLNQRSRDSPSACFWRDKQIFQVTDRRRHPGAFVQYADSKPQYLAINHGHPADDRRLRIQQTPPGMFGDGLRLRAIIELRVPLP